MNHSRDQHLSLGHNGSNVIFYCISYNYVALQIHLCAFLFSVSLPLSDVSPAMLAWFFQVLLVGFIHSIHVLSLDTVFSTIPLFFLRFAIHCKLVSGISL